MSAEKKKVKIKMVAAIGYLRSIPTNTLYRLIFIYLFIFSIMTGAFTNSSTTNIKTKHKSSRNRSALNELIFSSHAATAVTLNDPDENKTETSL